jgi:hypothetical protein
MMAPFRTRPPAKGGVYKVNEDPKRLDDAYIRMLGNGGDKVLSEEVKWLAVTHKSFDHGKRGFNDRLAYLGMLVNIEALWHGRLILYRTEDSGTTNITSAHKLATTDRMAQGYQGPTQER